MGASASHSQLPILPSKRNLADYDLASSDGNLNHNLAKVRKAKSFASPDADPGPSSSSSSTTLHFFVRASQTLVIHASPHDTVESVIKRVAEVTGITTSEERLIYSGRQLLPELTLADSSVLPGSTLHLTWRLRSTRCPRAWQVVNDLIYFVSTILGRDYPASYGETSHVLRLVREFLLVSSKAQTGLCDNLHVFLSAGAPAALVKLYISPFSLYKKVAKQSILQFLKHNGSSPDVTPIRCTAIVLEFAKLLATTVGRSDPLYIKFRSVLVSLLKTPECLETEVEEISELLPFFSDMAEILMASLSSDTMMVPSGDLSEFLGLSFILRGLIEKWIRKKGHIPQNFGEEISPYEDWVGSLHDIFLNLLGMIDMCLKKVEDLLLVQNGSAKNKFRCAKLSHILVLLLELTHFSDMCEGAKIPLNSVLSVRRFAFNALIGQARRSDAMYILLRYKDVIEFEGRRNLVMMTFPERNDNYLESYEMLIDRSQLLAESFEYIAQADGTSLQGGLLMEFTNEEARGPGVLREWFSLICQEIFNPKNVLFLPCPNDRRRFFPSPASSVDPLHLEYFHFSGRIIALALMHGVQVGIMFDRAFFLLLSGKNTITLEDVQDADPCFYMSCKKILEMNAELLDSDVLGLTFIREFEESGTKKVVELCTGGDSISVNSKNRKEYVNLLIQHLFVISIYQQVYYFSLGFGDILSRSELQEFFFQSLDLKDFDRMLGGSDNVLSVRDWRAHTELNGYKAKDRYIGWFWKIVEGMPAERRRMLLFFWTSVKYLPADGFGGLNSKLYLSRASGSHDRLPTSHTCFYRLCLPPYPSMSIMRNKLCVITEEHMSCTFGMS